MARKKEGHEAQAEDIVQDEVEDIREMPEETVQEQERGWRERDLKPGLTAAAARRLGIANDIEIHKVEVNGKTRNAVYASGRTLLRAVMKKYQNQTGITDQQIDDTVQFMDDMGEYMRKAGAKYTFVGLNDINDAKLIIDPRDKTKVILSAKVKNGEYDLNFDFTKVCKKRVAFSRFIDDLASRPGRQGGENMLDEIALTPENIFKMNEILRDAGYETACLGCFVESRRYNIRNWANVVMSEWNDAVDKINPNAEYFNFATDTDQAENLTMDDINAIEAEMKEYRKGAKGTHAAYEKIEPLLQSSERLQKKLRIGDLISSQGRTALHAYSAELESIVASRWGSNTPKSVELFAPYNSEIELLPDKKGSRSNTVPMLDYVKSIAGVRSQSFSDFIITHVFDHLQKTAGLAAKGMTAHTYTKEISRALLFGMTGEKVNLSLMFEIDTDVDWMHAGLDKNGDYFVADYETAERMEKITGKKQFTYSIPYRKAVEIEHDPLYSKNVGLIGVGYSYYGMQKMYQDADIPYIIGYHRSGLPNAVMGATHIELAADYTPVQNTLRFQKDYQFQRVKNADEYNIPSYATWKAGVKETEPSDMTYDLQAELRKNNGDAQKTMTEFLEWMDENHLSPYTEKALAGHGEFDVYGSLARTNDPKATANEYMTYCIENGMIPQFFEFSNEENYFKGLFDYSVIDLVTGETAQQQPVSMQGILDMGIERYTQIVDKYMAAYDRYNREQFYSDRYEETLNAIYENTQDATTMDDVQEQGHNDTQLDEESTDRNGRFLEANEKYKGIDLSKDGSVYTYDFLTSLPDVDITVLPNEKDVLDENGRIDRGNILERGIKNAEMLGRVSDGKVFVKNDITGNELRVDVKSIRHSLKGDIKRLILNSRFSSVIGSVIKNAVPINALKDTANNVHGTYAMASYSEGEDGNKYVGILTVEMRTGNVEDIEVFHVAHSISARHKNSSPVDYMSQGVYPSTATTITIAELIRNVNSTYKSILSEDVLKAIGEERPINGLYSDDVKFQQRDGVEIGDKLIAVHNLSVDNLMKNLRNGGFPAPSIGVVKRRYGNKGFGEVSVLFKKDTIDPEKSGYNKLYGDDAYTISYPTDSFMRDEMEMLGFDTSYPKDVAMYMRITENEWSEERKSRMPLGFKDMRATKNYQSLYSAGEDRVRLKAEGNEFENIEPARRVLMEAYDMNVGIDEATVNKALNEILDEYSVAASYMTQNELNEGMQTVDESYIVNELADRGVTVTDEWAARLIKELDLMYNNDVHYFEAKPYRNVAFDEIAAVIVPNTIGDDVRQALEDNGINYLEYEAPTNGKVRDAASAERQIAKVNEAADMYNEEDIMFQNRVTAVSNRQLLQETSEDAAMTATEREYLAQYKDATGKLVKLHGQREGIRAELLKAKQERDEAQVSRNRDRLMLMDERIERLMAKTVELERSQPIKDVMKRVRTEAESTILEAIEKNPNTDIPAALKSMSDIYKRTITTLQQKIRDLENAAVPQMDRHAYDKVQAMEKAVPQIEELEKRMDNESDGPTKAELQRTIDRLIHQLGLEKSMRARDVAREVTKRKNAINRMREEYAERDKTKEQLQNTINQLLHKIGIMESAHARDLAIEVRNRRNAIDRLHEQRAASEFRDKIRRIVDSFNTQLAHPKKKKYIPVQMVRSLVEVLDSFDFSYRKDGQEVVSKKVQEMKNLYAQLKNDDTYAFVHNDIVEKCIERIAVNMGQTKFRDLNSQQLEQIYMGIKLLHKVITDATKLQALDGYEDAIEAGRIAIEQVRNARPIVRGKVGEILQWMESPDTFINRISGYAKDSVLAKMQETIVKGEETMLRIQKDYVDTFGDLTKTKEFEALTSIAEKDLVDVGLHDENGEAIKITRGQMLALFMHLSSEDNLLGIARGGIKLPNMKEYYHGTRNAFEGDGTVRVMGVQQEMGDYRTALEEQGEQGDALDEKYAQEFNERVEMRANELMTVLGNILSEMNENEKKMIDAAREWFNVKSKNYLNAVTLDLYGFKAAEVENYFPIHRDSNFLQRDFDSVKMNAFLGNAGFMNERVKASQPVMLTDFAYEMASSVEQTSRYVGFVRAEHDFNLLYNTQLPGMTTSLKEQIGQKFGGGETKIGVTGKQYLENYINDIIGNRKSKPTVWNDIRSNLARASLSLNMRVAFSQAASIPTAAAELDWASINKALLQNGGTMFSTKQKNEIADQDIWFWQRYRGEGGMTEFADARKNGNALDRAYNKVAGSKIGKHLFNWCQDFDVGATALLYRATEEWVRSHTDYAEGSEEFRNAVADKYRNVLRKTQPMYMTTARSDVMRSQDQIMKTLTMFKTQASQNFNILADAAGELHQRKIDLANGVEGVTEEDVAKAQDRFVHSVTAVPVAALTFALFRLLANMLTGKMKPYKDRDDGDVDAVSIAKGVGVEAAESLASMVLMGSEMAEWLEKAITGDKYYGMSETAVTQLSAVAEAAMDMVKNAKDPKKFGDSATKMVKKIASLLGIPSDNALTLGEIPGNLYNLFANGFDFSSGTGRTAAQQYVRAIGAFADGDDKAYEQIIDEMCKKDGKTRKEAQSGIRNKAIDMYADGDITYTDLEKLLIDKFGKTADDVYWAADKAMYKKKHGDTKGYSYTQKIEDAIISGGDVDGILKSEYMDHGYAGNPVKPMEAAIKNLYAQEKIDWAQAEELLKKYGNYTNEDGTTKDGDLYYKHLEWDAANDQDRDIADGTWSKYADLETALEAADGEGVKAAITDLLEHDVKKSNIASKLSGFFKDVYISLKATDPTAAEAYLTNTVIPAYVAAGYTEAKERKYIAKNWK